MTADAQGESTSARTAHPPIAVAASPGDSGVVVLTALSYRARKQRERATTREAANARAKTMIDPARLADPLVHPAERRRLAMAAAAIAGALAVHAAVVMLASLGRVPQRAALVGYDRAVEVRVAEPPRPAALAPSPERVPAPPPKPPPALKKTPKTEKTALPPPDPIDTQTPPPPEPPKRDPPRRVVGIDMESVTTGGGPAYAVGNTRMGRTEEVAQDPTGLERLAPQLIPPKRTSAPTPAYPPALKAQGIEGEVELEVAIDATGHVSKVTVIGPSEHDEFNRSAVESAEQSTYEAARANGVAVAHSITFTVRFRLR